MGSIPTAELIDQVERSFLCSTNEKEQLQRIPLLQEFENEMKIYQVCIQISIEFANRDICLHRHVYLIFHRYPIVGMFNGFKLIFDQ